MLNHKSKIRLDDIARKLNVSKVTVSKALRDHPDISEDTIQLVKKTADKLGYIPNLMARNLSSKKTNTIGVVVPVVSHFFFSKMIEAIYDKAFNNNYEIILTVSNENPVREKKHLETLLSMQVDGIIVSITKETEDKKIFKSIKQNGIPLVFVDRVIEDVGCSTITVDNFKGSYNAVKKSIELGYKKIAFIGGSPDINIGKYRLEGYKKALRDCKIKINNKLIFHGSYEEQTGYDALMKLHEHGSLPEFIFAATYPVALGVYDAAKKLQLKIPEDIDLISFGDSDINHYITPSLSCVHQPANLLGERAVETVLNEIKNPKEKTINNIEIPTNLIIRETFTKK